MKEITTIDEVLSALDQIIQESKEQSSPLGYFAALYKKVTQKVRDGIDDGCFDDGPRMERLDVIFANRYISTYKAYQKHEPVTLSWMQAFQLSKKNCPIVLQHLLIGMNTHINLDLGIAAAKVMEGKDIQNLKDDFDKINDILSSLVADVEQDLSEIWPTLKKILQCTVHIDNFLIDFSMQLARDGAWSFAKILSLTPEEHQVTLIRSRDQSVAKIGRLVSRPGLIVGIIFKIIRLGERGTVIDKIVDMEY